MHHDQRQRQWLDGPLGEKRLASGTQTLGEDHDSAKLNNQGMKAVMADVLVAPVTFACDSHSLQSSDCNNKQQGAVTISVPDRFRSGRGQTSQKASLG